MSIAMGLIWYLLPAWALSVLLRSRIAATDARWALAIALWIPLSGVWLRLLSLAPNGVAFRFVTVTALPLVVSVIVIAVAAWRARRNALEPLQEEAPQLSPIAGIVVAVGALVFATTLSSAWSVSGGAADFLAHAARARIAYVEHGFASSVVDQLYGTAWASPLPAWTQTAGAFATRKWVDIVAKLPAILLWIGVAIGVFGRLRGRDMPLLPAALASAVVFLLPGVSRALGMSADITYVAGFSALAFLFLQAPRLPWAAIMMTAAAMAWNPAIAWPCALATALVLLVDILSHRRGERFMPRKMALGILGFLFILALFAAQLDTFFSNIPATLLPQRDALYAAWRAIGSGDALLLAALVVAAALLLRRSALSNETWRNAVWVGAFGLGSAVALLFTTPSISAATLRLNPSFAPLAIFLPLVVTVFAALRERNLTLSEYVPAQRSAETVGTENNAEIAPQVALNLEEMREQLSRGYTAYGSGALEEASQLVDGVLAADAQHPDAHHLLGLIALAQARPGDALRHVQRAIDVYPEHALFHLTAADIYASQQRLPETIEALQNAVHLDPSNVATKTKLLLNKKKWLIQRAKDAQAIDSPKDTYAIITNDPAPGSGGKA